MAGSIYQRLSGYRSWFAALVACMREADVIADAAFDEEVEWIGGTTTLYITMIPFVPV